MYITTYEGEGGWNVWHRGKSYSVESFWPDHVGKRIGAEPAQLIFPPTGTWWVRIVNRRGQVGWIEGGHISVDGMEGSTPSFDGADSCA